MDIMAMLTKLLTKNGLIFAGSLYNEIAHLKN